MVADIASLAQELLDCVCATFNDAGRPACDCYPTIGPPLVGPCCACEDPAVTGNITINFETMYPADSQTLERVARIYPCRMGTVAADFTVVLTRCYPTVRQEGTEIVLPSVDEQRLAAEDLHTDVNLMWQALTCCPGVRMRWRDLAVDTDPEGGCSMLAARFTVEAS